MSLPSSRDTEIQQLKNQLQHCLGKLKGYETLGQLFQESKQECAHYKQTNEELAHRLDSLTRKICQTQPENPEVVGASRTCDETVGGDFNMLETVPEKSAEGPELMNLKEIGVKTPPPTQSASTSNSFVQISGSETSSMDHDNSLHKENLSKLQVYADAMCDASVDLSPEIAHLTEQIQTLGQSSTHGDNGTTVEDLASDLIKAGVSVIKLQKQTRIQHVYIDQLKSRVSELEADSSAKQNRIQILQKDCDTLRKTVYEMEGRQTVAGGGAEWLEVEKGQHQGSEDIQGAFDIVTATPLAEVELRRRVEKLSATINELVSVNQSWDEHCRQLESSHQAQVTTLEHKLTELQKSRDEFERNERNKQRDFDNVLLEAKKQREHEEMAKVEALNELLLERQHCTDLQQKMSELEQRLLELQSARQTELVNNLPTIQMNQPPLSDRESELCSQVLVLQQQVTLYKEDFDQERHDREVLQAQLQNVRKDYSKSLDQINASRSQLSQVMSELSMVRNESQQWRQRYHQLSGDLQALQRQARPVNQRPGPTHVPVSTGFTNVRPPLTQTSPSWTCLQCTFKNSGQRSTCEMCGNASYSPINYYQYLADDRMAAGLSVYPHTPPTGYHYHHHLDSHSLETDSNQKQ